MILKKIDGKIALTNLFADYILEQIGPKKDSIIRVVNLENFVVVKGVTNSTDILDLTKVKEDFQKKFNNKFDQQLYFKNTIDLIEYDVKIKESKAFEHTYFQSDNNSFNPKQIENFLSLGKSNDYINTLINCDEEDMIITSSFPHGFSIRLDRDLYYYFKKIFNSIPSNYPWSQVKVKVCRENIVETLEVYDSNGERNNTLESFILDYFNFNLTKIRENISYEDFYREILNPLEENKLIKKDNDDYIII